MENPLEQSIKSAVDANAVIGDSFARLGSSHPGGIIPTAYRNAKRAMAQALVEADPLAASLDVLRGLRYTLESGVRSELVDMQGFGLEEANRQLAFYGHRPQAAVKSMELSTQINSSIAAVMAAFEAQEAQVKALIVSDFQPEIIVGDDERQGVLRPGTVLAAATFWAAALVWDAFSYRATQAGPEFGKQAVAALDNRTTDCCLRVHGQVVPFKGEFALTGTPRFADKMDWSPFHWNCRTSIALYLAAYDLGLSEKMRSGAATILAERAAGKWIDRHPASAFA